MEAVQLLQKTYGKRKLIIQSRLHALFDLESPKPNSAELGRFRSQYEAHIRGLKSLGADIQESGYIYATVILRKLPRKIADNINRASKTDTWSLDELRSAIEVEIDHLRASEVSGNDSTSYLKGESISTMSVLTNNKSRYSSDKPVRACLFCNGDHLFSFCNKYPSIETRRDRVTELKLCYNCLRDNHSVRYCKSTTSCKNCHRRHHTIICNEKISRYSNQSGNYNGDRSQGSGGYYGNRSQGVGGYNGSRSRDAVGYNAGRSLDQGDARGGSLNARGVSNNVMVENCDYGHGDANVPNGTSVLTNLQMQSGCESSILPTANIFLKDNCGNLCSQRVLFDTGAQRSYILKETVQRLGIVPTREKVLTIGGFNAIREATSYPIVDLVANSNQGNIQFCAIVIDKLPNNISMPGRDAMVHSLEVKGIHLADNTPGDECTGLSLVIGIDNYFKFVYAQPINDSLFLIPTKIGNLVAGNISCPSSCNTAMTTILHVSSAEENFEPNLSDSLSKFWELDNVGLKPVSLEEDTVLNEFNEGIYHNGERYVVGLPWKPSHPTLPNNYYLVFKRLKSTLDKLRRSQGHLELYNKIIHDQLESGFIEEVTDKVSVGNKVHYLSHQAVLKDSKTTPLRIVFNCSAKKSKHSPSLNECLNSGPSLINDLCSVLMRFRLHEYACTADIAKAFLQVGLKEEDRDFTRFLWPKNPLDPNSEIITYRFRVVLFGATCSQFLLNITVLFHWQHNFLICCKEIFM